MKDKRPNVAAGRLGDIALGADSSASQGRARDSYNTNRLGIVSEAETGEPEIQVPAPEPQDVPQVVASERAVPDWMPEPEPASQAVDEPAPELRVPWEDAPEAEPFGEEEELSGWAGRARPWMPQTRKGALAMASAAVCAVMTIVVLVWWFRDEPRGPEQAAAETPSGVVAQPAAAGARPGDGTGASRSAGAAVRKRPRIVFAKSTRHDDPKRSPQSPWPSPVPSAPKPPIATSRPAAPTTTMPASAAPGRTETPTTKPAAATPPATPPGPPPALRVSCVMKGPSGPAAIINGACVTIGDTLNGAKIIAIGQFTVEVEYTGHKYFIGVSAPGRSASTAAHEEDEAAEEEEDEDEDEEDSDEE